jgi:L-2-aminoadipate reductase
MPLTPNGKVDKNSLPFPDTALAAAAMPSTSQSNDELTSTQASLRKVWATLLKIDENLISVASNFFDIGGHSIMATRLVFSVRNTFAIDAPLGMVYKSPTLKTMAEEVDFLRGEDLNLSSAAVAGTPDQDLPPDHKRAKSYEPNKPAHEELFDYAADLDIVDEESLSCNGLPSVVPSAIFASDKPPKFFLTGVTGFLGAFILQSIFKNFPQASVWCLVRAKSDAEGHERIILNCKKHLISTDAFYDRIHACEGDLGKDYFGLKDELWTYICESTDIIIHNGALVHWIYPYQKLRGPNVIGTKTALRMATTHHLKPLHFVSSTSVLDTAHVNDF